MGSFPPAGSRRYSRTNLAESASNTPCLSKVTTTGSSGPSNARARSRKRRPSWVRSLPSVSVCSSPARFCLSRSRTCAAALRAAPRRRISSARLFAASCCSSLRFSAAAAAAAASSSSLSNSSCSAVLRALALMSTSSSRALSSSERKFSESIASIKPSKVWMAAVTLNPPRGSLAAAASFARAVAASCVAENSSTGRITRRMRARSLFTTPRPRATCKTWASVTATASSEPMACERAGSPPSSSASLSILSISRRFFSHSGPASTRAGRRGARAVAVTPAPCSGTPC
mmetsp:Transcript_86066/g.229686  ORF Transcript_86066/g.229686 Transcript_86066/m.229686 type:complete len:288 (-) Transcript_86066:73-936(-)